MWARRWHVYAPAGPGLDRPGHLRRVYYYEDVHTKPILVRGWWLRYGAGSEAGGVGPE
jgi:hypothetical protein